MIKISIPPLTDEWSFVLCDSLEKVFPAVAPTALNTEIPVVVFQGSRSGFQVAFKPPRKVDRTRLEKLKFEVDTSHSLDASVSSVELVPVVITGPEEPDPHYLVTEPGLYPDLLIPQPDVGVQAIGGQWRAVWVELTAAADAPSEDRVLTVRVVGAKSNELLATIHAPVRIVGVELPELEIDNAQWFHCDGLADFYGLDVFSEAHWAVIEKQMAASRRVSMNTILTPTWTPPLDTAVGGTRTATQLIGIADQGGGSYQFDFSKLERWIGLCKQYGFRKLEIAHFFSQWGAEATPAIYVDTPAGQEMRFGWHVAATSPQYRNFLEQLVPQLRAYLDAHWGIENVLFHISDEPTKAHLEGYAKSRAQVADLLEGCVIVDAISDFELFQTGAVPYPIVANDNAQPFLDAQVPLWLYYCVAQDTDVANRFISQPSTRSRIIGAQLFLTGAQGFLQWGFNFYNSFHSTRLIDPFKDTCAGNGFPGGDPFLVYPGPDGEVYESIRFKVFADAMNDLRAMELLRSKAGADAVRSIIDPDSSITLTNFSYDPDHYRRVATELAFRLLANQ